MPSDVISRLTTDSWIASGSKKTLDRAHDKVNTLLQSHIPEDPEQIDELERTFDEIKKKYKSPVH